jgi:hypothetical protein
VKHLYVTTLVVVLVVGASAQGQAPSDPQQQVQALVNLYQAEREKTEALAMSAASKTQQIQQLQQALNGASTTCIAEIEKANTGKTVDAKTWVISNKPAGK